MLIDFHTHTTASDGALAPAELLHRAAEAGVRQLAITDHDTVAGYLEVAAHYTRIHPGLSLVSGIELSCCWSATTVHIVGLGMDCQHPALIEGVTTLGKARLQRAERIAERLEKLGFQGALAGARAAAGRSQIGRPHFAAWLVAEGHVADAHEAFDRYLGAGKTGDVKAFWPELDRVCRWIVDSGGVAIIAHPLKYKFTRMKLQRLVVDFKAAGGCGVEIASGRQTGDQLAQLSRLARENDLLVSGGSDFHRDSPWASPLGVELAARPGLEPVWSRLGDSAAPAGDCPGVGSGTVVG